MFIVNVEQMRDIEAKIDASGVSYDELMQRAGRSTADLILAKIEDIQEPQLTFIIGKGNNGGDGIIAGLHVAQDRDDALVRFYLLEDRDDEYIKIARDADLLVTLSEHDKDKRLLRNMVASSDVVIDALFGIGVRLPIKDEASKILRIVKQGLNEAVKRDSTHSSFRSPTLISSQPQRKPLVIAVDCPSGLDCDTGNVDKQTLHADITITYLGVKQGLLQSSALDYVGTLITADLGIDKKHPAYNGLDVKLVHGDEIPNLLPERKMDGNKGTFGKVLIVGGSENYIGAPVLSARATYRVGSGLVTIGTLERIVQLMSSSVLEPTWLILPKHMNVISVGGFKILRDEVHKYSAFLYGPGMAQHQMVQDLLLNLLRLRTKVTPAPDNKTQTPPPTDDADESVSPLPPLVIDADGLNALARRKNWWEMLPEKTILTPHPGEMARLTGLSTKEIQANRLKIAIDYAKQWKCIVVLKGAYTVIGLPDGTAKVIPFANDGLATAGTGDVLAGMIVGFLGQAISPEHSAILGAYLHGYAGELATQKHGKRGMTAGDLLEMVPHILRDL